MIYWCRALQNILLLDMGPYSSSCCLIFWTSFSSQTWWTWVCFCFITDWAMAMAVIQTCPQHSLRCISHVSFDTAKKKKHTVYSQKCSLFWYEMFSVVGEVQQLLFNNPLPPHPPQKDNIFLCSQWSVPFDCNTLGTGHSGQYVTSIVVSASTGDTNKTKMTGG